MIDKKRYMMQKIEYIFEYMIGPIYVVIGKIVQR